MYAARTLRKNPGFTLAALVTLALGIAAGTAIFSVVNAVLLKPLPYKDPARLVVACGEMRKRNVKDWPFSHADFFDLRNGTSSVFSGIAGVLTGRGSLPKEDGAPEEVRLASATANIFRLLGARIVIGRDFTDADGQPGPEPTTPAQAQAVNRVPTVAILSYEYFQRRYGGDPSIIGRNLKTAGGNGPQIVGVLAPGFSLLFPPSANIEAVPDVWMAQRLAYDNARRNEVNLHVVARLKNGVGIDRAQAQTDAIAAELRRNFPIKNTSGFFIGLEPMGKHLVTSVRPAILALMGAVIFLLLIACANVANLMLIRMSARQRELAIRNSLGGTAWRLVRQTLIESVLLAGLGTLAGLPLAWLGIHELLAVVPADLPRVESVRIDPTVLLFTASVGLFAAVLFGIVPALRAARPDIMNMLRGGRTSGLRSGGLLRSGVVVAEIALCFVLLIGSGLMFRSFLALQHIDPGFEARNLLTFELLGLLGATPQERAASMRLIHDRLSALPGIQSVTAANPFPLTGNFTPIRWGTEQALTDATKFHAVDFQFVIPGYFETIRTALIAGRTFTDADNAPTRNVVIVDEFLATKAFPFESAVGKRILIRIRTPQPEWVEVIGVVKHQRTVSLAEPGREQIYFADGFVGHGAATHWAVRTAGDPSKYSTEIHNEMAKINRSLLITRMQPMESLVVQAQSGTRFSLLLIGVFAVIAGALAAVGLYGVLSSAVRQRTAEIGVRMALGARPANIFGLVIGNGLVLSSIGIVIGIAAAFGLTRLMTGMLVDVKATDPMTFAAMVFLFLVVAATASWLPARRASALDPTTALRAD